MNGKEYSLRYLSSQHFKPFLMCHIWLFIEAAAKANASQCKYATQFRADNFLIEYVVA